MFRGCPTVNASVVTKSFVSTISRPVKGIAQIGDAGEAKNELITF